MTNTPPDYLEPDWENAKRVHDWKNHVGDEIQALWLTFNPAQKAALARQAEKLASDEDWD